MKAMGDNATLGVEIWRGTETGQFQPFAIPRRAHQTVLDVVTEIQREHDATLSYRFACRVGMCGSCAMVVNGRPRWTCRTRVSEVIGAGGPAAARAVAQFHRGQGPGGRDDAVLRQVERGAGLFRAGRGAAGGFRGGAAGDAASGKPPTPASNASAAASAIRPATWSAGTRIISGRPRSTAPGRWSTTCATSGQRRPARRRLGQRRLPGLPYAYELHIVLPKGDRADLFDRRPETRGACVAACGAIR